MKEKHGLRSLNVQAKRLQRTVVQNVLSSEPDGTEPTEPRGSGDCPMGVEKKTTHTIFSISVLPHGHLTTALADSPMGSWQIVQSVVGPAASHRCTMELQSDAEPTAGHRRK